jgi:hypothetical protein
MDRFGAPTTTMPFSSIASGLESISPPTTTFQRIFPFESSLTSEPSVVAATT